MQCTQPHAIGAPAPMDKGFTPTPTGTTCLLSTAELFAAIKQAKHDKAHDGRGHAYADLLTLFHAAILPAFFVETQGNLSEVARLLGIHRSTIKEYCLLANVDMSGASVGGAV